MTINTPDNWIVFTVKGEMDRYKLLCGWSGGYTQGSSWRVSSGIVSAKVDGDYIEFTNHSGSVYRCHKGAYCVRMNTAHVIHHLENKYGEDLVELDENTDWENFDWKIV